MIDGEIVIRRVWRSQIKRLAIFFILCAGSVVLSINFPASVLVGKLFSIAGTPLYLALPLWSIMPLCALFYCLLPIYDAKLVIDKRGIELTVGILGLQYSVNRVRFEDVRGIELSQTLLERALNVGTIGISSAATEGVEVTFDGVGSPKEIQEMVQAERDIRKKAEIENIRSNKAAVGGE